MRPILSRTFALSSSSRAAKEFGLLEESANDVPYLGWHKRKIQKSLDLAARRQDAMYKKTLGVRREQNRPTTRIQSEFSGFGMLPSPDDPFRARNPGAPPKPAEIVEHEISHRFKAGGYKDDFHHDPFLDTSVSDSLDYLREALYPSLPKEGRQAPIDPVKVIECCQRLGPPMVLIRNKPDHPRLVPLDPYVDKIFEVLVPVYSSGPLPTPIHQTEVIETLERCLSRVMYAHLDATTPEAHKKWRKNFAQAAELYAKVVMYQAQISRHDPARLNNLLRLVDRFLDHYSSTFNYYIPVPLAATLVLLMIQTGNSFTPSKSGSEDYRVVWPSPEVVAERLEGITPEDVANIYSLRPFPPLPANLGAKLKAICKEDDGRRFAQVWRQFRDTVDEPKRFISSEPDDYQKVFGIFYYRLTKHVSENRHWRESRWPIPMNKLRKEILSRIDKPYPAYVLHGMLYARTRPISSYEPPEGVDPNVPVDTETRAAQLAHIWQIAQEPDHGRDAKFYSLYVSALASLNRPDMVYDAWEKCLREKKVSDWPPITVFNQVLAALLRCPDLGVKWALSLWRQACAKSSSIKMDHYTIAAMLEHYAKKGEVEEMQKIIAIGAKRGLEPNGVIYGTLIKGMSRAGRFDLVESTLRLMTEQGIAPSQRLFPTLVAGLTHVGLLERLREAEKLFTVADKFGVKVDLFSWASLIGGYFRGGWSEEGWDAVRRMEAAGVKMNQTAYNLVIQEAGKKVARRHGSERIGLEIVKRMLVEKVFPGRKSWELLLEPLVKAEYWNTAQEAYTLMENTRSAPDSPLLRKIQKHLQWKRSWT
ncbi:hypothetical protein BD324DRAFT_637794 [Kockovaella imperatae]|uniref:Pentacotripeptide-repeat region of PRORP domain-containing protein n=1 Tax=Kockovaella imperatae TaxID=4999 RepID=A0A1Y1U7F5_9TREE|nr:hypothetical protein BD324DRAFT_637794 [Kockovaella imperatae]ORX33959.1 hypothetical protein BD324DRAFT_637794 [Kockovaella imperatae]